MILTFFCFLLFTGGHISSSEELHDQQKSNQSFTAMPDGNATSSKVSHADNQTFNQSSDQKVRTCSYLDILNYLNFSQNKDMYTLTRPVKDHQRKTEVQILMVIYAILGLKMADQTFISYNWIVTGWKNEFIVWDPEDFCGISSVVIPAEELWKPDLTIEEMIEKDKAPPSPSLVMFSHGIVIYRNDLVIITTCKLKVYKFPFDIQSCNISFKSVSYSDDELNLTVYGNDAALTDWSRDVMDSQYEWLFLNESVITHSVDYFGYNQTVIVYTITMKRVSSLYVANFLMPVLFFLCLDFATLMMSDSGGEKVGFKITVLLAVTVMQLLLNEILPFTSRTIPLIVVYCIGIFALMLISLLEAILMKYLVEKDSPSQDDEADSNPGLKGERVIKKDGSISYEMGDQTSSLYKEGSSNQLMEIFITMEKVSGELEEMKRTMSLLSNTKGKVKPGYWTKLAKNINKVFSVFYVTGVIVFLCTIFSLWIF